MPCACRNKRRLARRLNAEFLVETSAVLEQAKKQLEDYFACRHKAFDIPLRLVGTDFQQQVWNALLGIPYGETVSYKDIALSVGNPEGVRAVAQAVGANGIAILFHAIASWAATIPSPALPEDWRQKECCLKSKTKTRRRYYDHTSDFVQSHWRHTPRQRTAVQRHRGKKHTYRTLCKRRRAVLAKYSSRRLGGCLDAGICRARAGIGCGKAECR